MSYTEELTGLTTDISIYSESMLRYIDSLEEMSMITESFFLEAEGNEKKNIFETIKKTVENIFKKIKEVFTKGKVKVKATTQAKSISSIGKLVKDYGDVKVTIPDVWKFSQFADNTIDKYVGKYDKKSVLTLMKSIHGDSVIKHLTTNLNEVSAAMKSSENTKIKVSKMTKIGKVKTESVATEVVHYIDTGKDVGGRLHDFEKKSGTPYVTDGSELVGLSPEMHNRMKKMAGYNKVTGVMKDTPDDAIDDNTVHKTPKRGLTTYDKWEWQPDEVRENTRISNHLKAVKARRVNRINREKRAKAAERDRQSRLPVPYKQPGYAVDDGTGPNKPTPGALRGTRTKRQDMKEAIARQEAEAAEAERAKHSLRPYKNSNDFYQDNIIPVEVPAEVEIAANGKFSNTAKIAAGLLILAAVISQCPKSIGTEKVTIKELYSRLVSLKPDGFPNSISATSSKANTYLQRVETMNDIINNGNGAGSVVKYTRDLSNLLVAYTNFHQSLIDYYIRIITNTTKK